MVYRVQIFYPGAGFYLNTNHVADDLDQLKQLVDSEAFSGTRLQVVDDAGTVCYGPIIRERQASLTLTDLAGILGVPILDRLKPTEDRDSQDENPQSIDSYGLEAIDESTGKSVDFIDLSETTAFALMREVWPGVDFWRAPGGSSILVSTSEEAEKINQMLGGRRIEFDPQRFRWLFHVYLT
jgi:hypothetical protein